MYQPLSTSTHEIRVVHILPALYGEPISIRLSHEDLDSTPQPVYEALSYEWGPETISTETIIVMPQGKDSFDVKIRKNLYWALQSLRREAGERQIWIDALCINQEDVLERSNQVRRMGDVYRLAKRVVIWLGWKNLVISDLREGSGNVIDYAWNLIVEQANQHDTIHDKEKLWTIPCEQSGMVRKRLKMVRSSPKIATALRRVCNLSRVTYWKRLWILQEIYLASRLFVQHRHTETRWEVFDSILNFMCSQSLLQFIAPAITNGWYGRKVPEKDGPLYPGYRSFINHSQADSDEAKTLAMQCEHFGNSQCESLHDKIFGLRSLSKSCCQEYVPVDYSKPFIHICHQLMLHEIQQHFHNGFEGGNALLDLPDHPWHSYARIIRRVNAFNRSVYSSFGIAFDDENQEAIPTIYLIDILHDRVPEVYMLPGYRYGKVEVVTTLAQLGSSVFTLWCDREYVKSLPAARPPNNEIDTIVRLLLSKLRPEIGWPRGCNEPFRRCLGEFRSQPGKRTWIEPAYPNSILIFTESGYIMQCFEISISTFDDIVFPTESSGGINDDGTVLCCRNGKWQFLDLNWAHVGFWKDPFSERQRAGLDMRSLQVLCQDWYWRAPEQAEARIVRNKLFSKTRGWAKGMPRRGKVEQDVDDQLEEEEQSEEEVASIAGELRPQRQEDIHLPLEGTKINGPTVQRASWDFWNFKKNYGLDRSRRGGRNRSSTSNLDRRVLRLKHWFKRGRERKEE